MKCMNDWCENEVSYSTKNKFNRGVTKTACCSRRCASILKAPKGVVCAAKNCCNFILPTQGRKYCGHSCATSYNSFGIVRNPLGIGGFVGELRTGDSKFTPNFNKVSQRQVPITPKSTKINTCLFCGEIIKAGRKYCAGPCQGQHTRQKATDKIEAGDTTLATRNYRRYLIEAQGPVCSRCGWSEVNPTSGKVPIVMDHIDGNSDNNSLKNLRLLCPNCDSLTPTYKALNTGNGRHSRRQRYADGKSY